MTILTNEKKQLLLFQIYLKILHKLLSQNKEDYILDKDKNYKASQGVVLACHHIREGIKQLEGLLEDSLVCMTLLI